MKFKNPQNDYVEEVSDDTWLWALLFGGFYFAYKGIWIHFIIGLILAIMTFGVSWFIYPLFARSIVIAHYQKSGWQVVSDAKKTNYTLNSTNNRSVTPKASSTTSTNGIVKSKNMRERKPATDYYPEEPDLTKSKYKLWLADKYNIKKNELFNQYEVADELRDTLEDAIAYAHELDDCKRIDYQKFISTRDHVKSKGKIGANGVMEYTEYGDGFVLVTHPSGVKMEFASLEEAFERFK